MDAVNAAFEFLSGFFVLLSVRRVLVDREVRGISWVHAAFFTAWGYWNLAFYPWLGQWWSFWGGAWLVFCNTWYLILLRRFGR